MARKISTTGRVANQIKKADTLAKIEDFMTAVVKEHGGVAALAKAYVEDYKASPPGSIARARLLEGTSRLIQLVSKRDSPTKVDDMTDEEIEQEIENRLNRIVEKTNSIEASKEGPDDGTPPPQ